MKTSQIGIDLIKFFESLHDGDLHQIGLQPKMCPAGIWTEGYGRAMRDATLCVLGHLENTLSINHQLKRPYAEVSTQGKFNVTNIFKLTTYRYVGGVLKIYLNNVEKTIVTGDWTISSNGSAANSLVLNHRGDYFGKVNQYKHLAIIAGGDLSGFNLSSYNSEIMTRYGL